MEIVGIGTDIVECLRIGRMIQEQQRLRDKTFRQGRDSRPLRCR